MLLPASALLAGYLAPKLLAKFLDLSVGALSGYGRLAGLSQKGLKGEGHGAWKLFKNPRDVLNFSLSLLLQVKPGPRSSLPPKVSIMGA